MVDSKTATAWSHLDGAAFAGPLAGEQLRVLPLQTTTWAAWREQYPQTTVPDIDTGYRYRDPRIGGGGLGQVFRDSLPELDPRLPENELVIGVLAGDGATAFPLRAAPSDAPAQDTVGGVPVVILEDGDGVGTLAYHRALSDGRVLDFVRRDGRVTDVQTGSTWNASGLATEGELAGVRLTFVTSFLTEWYGWAAFHPETAIYEGGEGGEGEGGENGTRL